MPTTLSLTPGAATNWQRKMYGCKAIIQQFFARERIFRDLAGRRQSGFAAIYDFTLSQ